MAVFRVERTRDYTVMCNHHLKDSNLSLKAKGLLSMMLSLPDEWNYTTRGLAAICKEGVDAIGKTLKELELAGYIIRRQLRGKDGRISDTEYTIFEKPRKPSPPDTTLPDTENPYLDNPDTEAPDTDNPAQLNTKKSNTQKSNTDLSSTHSFFLPAADGMTDGFEKKAEIREQIEYDILCQQYDRMQLDELVEIMLEVAMNRSPTVKIGRDAEYPTGFVQQRFEKITSMHIEKVMDGIRENTTRVWNTKAYLMAALFNSVSTMEAAALGATEGFKWGAISGAVIGGGSEAFLLRSATKSGLTMNEAALIQADSNLPLDVISRLHSMDEYLVYKKAGLKPVMVNGRVALVQNIDLNYVSQLPDGTEVTNLVRMQKGYAPLDPATGKAYQLHHIGQKADGTLAVLTEAQHQGNSAILNIAEKASEIDRPGFGNTRKEFWQYVGNHVFGNGGV